MENAGGLGRHLAERLAGSGESVVDVPPKLSARVRVLSAGNARKNDGLDAPATALAASRNERLRFASAMGSLRVKAGGIFVIHRRTPYSVAPTLLPSFYDDGRCGRRR